MTTTRGRCGRSCSVASVSRSLSLRTHADAIAVWSCSVCNVRGSAERGEDALDVTAPPLPKVLAAEAASWGRVGFLVVGSVSPRLHGKRRGGGKNKSGPLKWN